ncbi:hypothetical protein EHV15_34215 [Paenibacillus oralis]|uniref:Uncharacterized protein n=1 Tax=Paenibacillus oralis TaxID=2490856 RepID=A0A3P3TAT8_9BACL|nr:hypothetical protein [Paenibacillus oralis]RRJ54654.1 hypothetical protein EHV15_34215 [Paenibacillus oralis]
MSENTYLAVLESMRKSIDEKLVPMRQNYVYHMERMGGAGWFLIALNRSLFDFKGYKEVRPDNVGVLKQFAGSAATTYLGFAAFSGLSYLFHFELTNIMTWIVPFLWLVYRVRTNIKDMCTIGNLKFDIRAYKFKNKEEFEIFSSFLHHKEFTYEGLYSWIRDELIINASRRGNEITEIREAFENNAQELMEKIEELSAYQEENEKLNQVIKRLAKLSRQTLMAYKYAISELYRLLKEEGLFNPYDLRICSDFSLFELRGDLLYRLYEQGNSTTPRVISINDPRYRTWAAVRVIQHLSFREYSNLDINGEGRFVDSYRFVIKGRTFVYSFHFNNESKELRGLIESREMYRLIQGILLHLEERGMLLSEEAIRDVQ